jgi:plasmid stability protein
MTFQTVTIRLPDPIYRQMAQRARRKQRTIEDEVAEVVTNAIPIAKALPSDVTDALDQLTFLDDTELWQAAQSSLSPESSQQMQRLISKQQQQGLTPREQRRAEKLVRQYQRNMLIRAQAALLLKERGHNIDILHPQQ